MDNRTIDIVLNFIGEQAIAGMQAASAAIEEAFSGLGSSATYTSEALSQGFGANLTQLQPLMGGFIGNVKQATSAVPMWETAISGAGSALGNLIEKSKLASLFVGVAAVGVIGNLVNMTASAEQARIAFENLLKSPKQAGDLLDWLTKYSIQTPVARKELQDLSQTFLAYGANLQETKLAVQAVTEASSALGVSHTRLNTITYNLGQLFNSTTGSYRQLRDLQREGISTSTLLANAVNDHKLKLDGLVGSSNGAIGVSKKLSTEFQSASGNLHVYNEKVQLAQMRLDEYTKAHGGATSGILAHKIALEGAQKTLDKANTSIAQYSAAHAASTIAVSGHAEALKKLSREQEDAILKMNTGKDVAKALEEEMMKLYGGSALKQVQTFTGMLSNIPDILQFISQKVMGLDSAGNILKGGLFEKLKNVIADFLQFLLTHVDDISSFFNKMLNSTPGVAALAGVLGGMLLPALVGVLGPLIALGAIFGSLGYLIGIAIDKMGGFAKISKDFTDAIKVVQPFFEFLGKYKDIVIGALMGIGGAMLFAAIQTGLLTAALNILQATALFRVLILIGSIIAAINIWVLLIAVAIGVILAVVITHWKQIVQWTEWMVGQIAGFFTITIPTSLNNSIIAVGNFVNSVVTWFAALPGRVYAFMADLFMVKIPFAIGYMVGWVFVQLPILLTMMVTSFVDTGVKIWTEVSSWPVKFNNWMNKMLDDALNAAINFGINVVIAMVGTGINILAEIGTWPKRIMAFLNTLPHLFATMLSDLWTSITAGLGSIWKAITGWVDQVVGAFGKVYDAIKKALDLAGTAFKKGINAGAGFNLNSFDTGGIVPGPIGAAQLAIVHGGERVISNTGMSGSNSGGGGVNINFYGDLSVDSEDRIRQLADQISRMLGRQNELARYGAGY